MFSHESRSRSSRYSLVMTEPLVKPFGPLSASCPTISLSIRENISSSTMRSSSSRSFRTCFSSSRSTCSARASFSTPSRVKTRTSITVPSIPGGTRSDVSFTSDAFSPKMARNSFSSGVSWVSPLGVTLPTRISFGFTSAPT